MEQPIIALQNGVVRDESRRFRTPVNFTLEAGEHIASNPPYGYIKDPQDKKKWIVDEEAAKVVQRIFNLCIAGKGPMQIAKILTADRVLTVTDRKTTVRRSTSATSHSATLTAAPTENTITSSGGTPPTAKARRWPRKCSTA